VDNGGGEQDVVPMEEGGDIHEGVSR